MDRVSNKSHSSFRFSIRTLMVLTIAVAVIVASFMAIQRTVKRDFGYGPYATYDDWPFALQGLVESDQQLIDDVTPFGLSNFIDHCSIWQIAADSKLRTKLNETHQLIRTDPSHSKARFLIESMPKRWRKPDFSKCNWFATLGFGTKHIEGLDLFLIVDDPKSGESIVLHEWVF